MKIDITKHDSATLAKIYVVLQKFIDDLEEEHPELYEELNCDLYEVLYGQHFNEDLALKATKTLLNEDGTTGPHWSSRETLEVAQQYGVQFSSFNQWDWYYVINMIYSDHYRTFMTNIPELVRFTQDWLNDKDVASGKAWRYYTEVVLE